MDLVLNNLQRLICHKTQETNQPEQNEIILNRQHVSPRFRMNEYIYIYISSIFFLDVFLIFSDIQKIFWCFYPQITKRKILQKSSEKYISKIFIPKNQNISEKPQGYLVLN